MYTRTLAQLRTGVGYRADVRVTSAGRHSEAVVDWAVNQAIRKLHQMQAESGMVGVGRDSSLVTTATTTESNGWPQNQVATLPSDFLTPIGFSVGLGDDQWVEMLPFDEEERETYREHTYYEETGAPMFYRVVTGNDGTPLLRILPAADGVYSIAAIYITEPTTLVSDGDTYQFFDGGEEWVECDAAQAVLTRDGVKEPRAFQALQGRKSQAEARLLANMNRLGGGPSRRHDVTGMRARNRFLAASLYRSA